MIWNGFPLSNAFKRNRSYRFYIKCTACVSEICFRTDPESCDYVLEAGKAESCNSEIWAAFLKDIFVPGATRNFEALKRAEEQLEREEMAYREELENNPMKLLEERTAARYEHNNMKFKC